MCFSSLKSWASLNLLKTLSDIAAPTPCSVDPTLPDRYASLLSLSTCPSSIMPVLKSRNTRPSLPVSRISLNRTSSLTKAPGAMSSLVFLLTNADGRARSFQLLPLNTTVCPALTAPHLTATATSSAKLMYATIFPLPSSPKKPPTTMVSILSTSLVLL